MKQPQPYKLKQRVMRLALASALAFCVTPSLNAYAAATSNMAVSATVSGSCTISAGALAFGSYDPVSTHASTDLDGSATLTVNCTSGSNGTITLGQGSNANTGSTDIAPARRLKDAGTNHLSYALYSDSARTVVWGADTTNDVVYTGVGTAEPVSVYGRITSGQNVPAGTYSDTVLVSITF